MGALANENCNHRTGDIPGGGNFAYITAVWMIQMGSNPGPRQRF
jgi:hypothetical protein